MYSFRVRVGRGLAETWKALEEKVNQDSRTVHFIVT